MGKTYKDMKIRVEGKRRAKPDTRRLARAIIEMAQAQAEAEAEAEAHGVRVRGRKPPKPKAQPVREQPPEAGSQ